MEKYGSKTEKLRSRAWKSEKKTSHRIGLVDWAAHARIPRRKRKRMFQGNEVVQVGQVMVGQVG